MQSIKSAKGVIHHMHVNILIDYLRHAHISISRYKCLWYQLHYETNVFGKSLRSVQCVFINFLLANDNA